MNPDRIAQAVAAELIEQPLLNLGAANWRPTYGAEDGSIAVYEVQTESLGHAIRRRIDAALVAGVRVWVALPLGPLSLDLESQEFLLQRSIGILLPVEDDDTIERCETYPDAVRRHHILLDPTIGTPAIEQHLTESLGVTGEDRGKALERALAFGVSQVPGWEVSKMNFKTENEELDVVVRNNSAMSPWNGSAYILLEAKNWSSNVGRIEYDALHNKIRERGGASRIGIFVAATGFSSGFYERASHFGVEAISVVPVRVRWLAERMAGGQSIEEALAERVESVVLDRKWED